MTADARLELLLRAFTATEVALHYGFAENNDLRTLSETILHTADEAQCLSLMKSLSADDCLKNFWNPAGDLDRTPKSKIKGLLISLSMSVLDDELDGGSEREFLEEFCLLVWNMLSMQQRSQICDDGRLLGNAAVALNIPAIELSAELRALAAQYVINDLQTRKFPSIDAL